MPDINYQLLAQELLKANAATSKGVVSGTVNAGWGHGPTGGVGNGGLFSYPGMSKPVFSAMVLPIVGLQSILPVRASADANPLYGLITGVTDTSGEEPTGVCDDPPTVGLTKLCEQSFVFGRMARQTKVFDLDRFGLMTNRGEMADLSFIGNPFQGNNPMIPTSPQPYSMSDVLNNEVGKLLFEFGVAWSRDFCGELYTGNPANNTAGGGRKYYHGLDWLINTGHRDAVSGQLCPAADSIVRSFGDLNVATNGSRAVATITDIMRRLRFIANGTGLAPTKWAICMRWSLFYQLTEVWPCAYHTYRCANSDSFDVGEHGGAQISMVGSSELITMRDSMRGDFYNRTGQYLLIDSERVPVILDDCIAETVLAGETFESAIYFVPMTVVGGTPVTFMEHINYDAPYGAMDAARLMAPEGFYYTSDSGRFLWHKKLPNNFCVQLMAKAEPRLLLLTPHLAARLMDVRYTPLAHERDWDPDGSYYVDGGVTSRPGFGPSFFFPSGSSGSSR